MLDQAKRRMNEYLNGGLVVLCLKGGLLRVRLMSMNLLTFLAYFSRVLYKFNARFKLISLKNVLIPHLNVFCRF